MDDRRSPAGARIWILWALIILELISPVPALLTFGAAWVLLMRPPWFRRWVDELYG